MAADPPAPASFLPGMEFLEKVLGQAGAAVPGLGPWATPTLDPQELSKRIEELRTVQFWLENNARMIATTLQALEVQRMTLTALKSMNVQIGDLAAAFRVPTPPVPPARDDVDTQADASASVRPSAPVQRASAKAEAGPPVAPAADGSPAPGMVDPMQWWNTLTHQFGQIAAQAMKEGSAAAASGLSSAAGAGTGSDAGAASSPAVAAAAKTGTARRPARKTAVRR